MSLFKTCRTIHGKGNEFLYPKPAIKHAKKHGLNVYKQYGFNSWKLYKSFRP